VSQRFYIETLGCPKNDVDSDKLVGALLADGMEATDDAALADLVVVNTCAFIDEARRESIDTILALDEQRRDGSRLVVTGCMAERYGDELAAELPEVDQVAGFGQAFNVTPEARDGTEVPNGSQRKLIPVSSTPLPEFDLLNLPRPRSAVPWAYVKIAEGCSNACSYCTLPKIRGPLRSRPPEEIVREAAHLARQGVKEINLVAQDVTAYGRDREPNRSGSLAALLAELEQVQGVQWIRLLYCHPAHLDEDTIAGIGNSEKICPYVDLPIQHVSRSILKAMGRPYDEERLRGLIERIRSLCPDISLRTTVMVGFPGETEKDLEQLLSFVQDIRFDHLGVFCYSPEEGTAAFSREESISDSEKWDRCDRVMALQSEISESILQGFLGTSQEILIEGPHEEEALSLKARTRYQAPEVDGCVILPRAIHCGPGLARAQIVRARTYDLEAEFLQEAPPA